MLLGVFKNVNGYMLDAPKVIFGEFGIGAVSKVKTLCNLCLIRFSVCVFRLACNVALLALMWIIWRERNRRTFKGVEMSFRQLRSSLRFLFHFWCTNVILGCIEDWGLHLFVRYLLFWYPADFSLLIYEMNCLSDKKRSLNWFQMGNVSVSARIYGLSILL